MNLPKEQIEERISKLVRIVRERVQECKENGHVGPVNPIIPYGVSSRSNPLRDQVTMMCGYCGKQWQRHLNDEERRQISEFNKMIHGTDLIY